MRTKKRLAIASCAVAALAVAATIAMPIGADEAYVDTRIGNNIGFGANGGTTLDNYPEYAELLVYADKIAANAEAHQPDRYIDDLGNVFQQVPSDPKGWNLTYLSADTRGCLACHTSFDDIVMSLPTKHNAYGSGYATQTTIANCLGCHRNAGFGNIPLFQSLHGIHNGNAIFGAMGGSCDSCHYFSNADNPFELWDFAKYDVFQGFTAVAADKAVVETSFDQATISDIDQIFFESLNNEPALWRTWSDPAVAEQWVVRIGGEVENPIEMTVPELIEKFGTKTFAIKQPCVENAFGNAWIFQAEFTGISMKDIIDYVKPADTVTNIKCTSEDGYNMVSPAYGAINCEDCLLVTSINGEPLPAAQGYPLTLVVPRGTAASYIKAIMTIDFITKDGGSHTDVKASTGPVDPHTGLPQGCPNSAVLNYPDGVVLPAGQPVCLEGYADAMSFPITKIEFSLDKGKTWIEMETPDNDPTCWTYWHFDFTPDAPGAYLLKIRTTCLDTTTGEEMQCGRLTNFMFTVE